jgi:hypothetical protein
MSADEYIEQELGSELSASLAQDVAFFELRRLHDLH